MKKFYTIAIAAILIGSLQSCLKDDCTATEEFYRYDYVYLTTDQFRREVTPIPDRILENPGKMYLYGQYLFINEMGRGVHVYDMSTSGDPDHVSFYPIEGNFDIVIKDGILIADNVIDLISIDITNIEVPLLINRVENYKDEYIDGQTQFYAYSVRSNQTQVMDCSLNNGNDWVRQGDIFFGADALSSVVDESAFDGNGNSGSGISGSFARFVTVDNQLYTVDSYQLLAWNIEDPSVPMLQSTTNLGWGIETLFPYENNLFIGSNSGMFIYDISSPYQPLLLSSFEHANACDPVVVRDDFAYVTLRDGSACAGFTNQLEIIDVSSLNNPKLVKVYPMNNPHGLSVLGDKLYLGEGRFGFKIFDISDKEDLDLLAHVEGRHTYDIIALNEGNILTVGDDGFYLYDTSNPTAPTLKGSIIVNN